MRYGDLEEMTRAEADRDALFDEENEIATCGVYTLYFDGRNVGIANNDNASGFSEETGMELWDDIVYTAMITSSRERMRQRRG